MFDIPNFVTLPIELGVALLILIMDRRQRQREQDSTQRFYEQQEEMRNSEIRQRERFNSWSQETTKRQMMMLESIMVTLDADKVDNFKTEVGSRYAKELSNDMEDLDDLLIKKKISSTKDPELEANIESKIEEIETANEIIKHFVPADTIKQINSIANSAKKTYMTLRDLPETLKKEFPNMKNGKVDVKIDDQTFKVDPTDQNEINDIKDRLFDEYHDEKSKILSTLNLSIKETIEEIANNIPSEKSSGVEKKILDAVKSSLLKGGIGKMFHPEEEDEDTNHEDEE